MFIMSTVEIRLESNYAILMLASKLGIRASDICNLAFENLKWETNMIEFIQKKTGKSAILPLLMM